MLNPLRNTLSRSNSPKRLDKCLKAYKLLSNSQNVLVAIASNNQQMRSEKHANESEILEIQNTGALCPSQSTSPELEPSFHPYTPHAHPLPTLSRPLQSQRQTFQSHCESLDPAQASPAGATAFWEAAAATTPYTGSYQTISAQTRTEATSPDAHWLDALCCGSCTFGPLLITHRQSRVWSFNQEDR